MIARLSQLIVFYLLCLIVTENSYADQANSVISINERSVNLTQFNMSYFIDKQGNTPFTKIQSENFINSKNELTLGTNAKTTWSKIIIKNNPLFSTYVFYFANPFHFFLNRYILYYKMFQIFNTFQSQYYQVKDVSNVSK